MQKSGCRDEDPKRVNHRWTRMGGQMVLGTKAGTRREHPQITQITQMTGSVTLLVPTVAKRHESASRRVSQEIRRLRTHCSDRGRGGQVRCQKLELICSDRG
jgi:hypothetical protein